MQGYSAGLFTPQVGEGHITIYPWNYSAVVAGTWANVQSGSYIWSSYWANSTHADLDQISYKAYMDIGTYTASFMVWSSTSTAILDLLIDSTSVGTVDTYGAGLHAIKTIASIAVTRGIKTIGIKANGRNGSSSDNYIILFGISLFRTA
jgi:hypothetical protein